VFLNIEERKNDFHLHTVLLCEKIEKDVENFIKSKKVNEVSSLFNLKENFEKLKKLQEKYEDKSSSPIFSKLESDLHLFILSSDKFAAESKKRIGFLLVANKQLRLLHLVNYESLKGEAIRLRSAHKIYFYACISVMLLLAFVVFLFFSKAINKSIIELRHIHKETKQFLASIPSILIGLDATCKITRWNRMAEEIFDIEMVDAVGRPLCECDIQWDGSAIMEHISVCRESGESIQVNDFHYTQPEDKKGFLDIAINPIVNDTDDHTGYLLLATETTEQKTLENQLIQAQKLESIGQLAAGIAHEINTPIQYVGDNTQFLQDAFNDIGKLLTKYEQVIEVNKTGSVNNELIKEVEVVSEEVDLDYLLEEIPTALQQSQEGTERVARIVRAMKEFSHPGAEEKTLTDINRALENTITVASNEWKYVAETVTEFDPSLPLVPCLLGELNQVFLNIIVNAAHAIAGAVDESSGEKGTITVSTCHENEWVEIRISDTGTGIPEKARPKIFDPFFTTKEVGKGSGQGLAISHSVIVDKHNGTLSFETEKGKGTTFIIHLPINSSKN